VVGEARHRDGAVAAGQGDIEDTGDEDGIIAE
jgi:hypothetical protein